MELDELKNEWNAVSQSKEQLSDLNPEKADMILLKHKRKLNKVIYPEITGMLICLAAVVYMVLQFPRLDTFPLQLAGIVFIILLVLLVCISISGLLPFIKPEDLSRPYTETLQLYAQQKIRFLRLQRINITLSYLLLVVMIILFSALFRGNDITGNKYFWIFSFSFGYLFILYYSKWVMKSYKNTIQKAQELLRDLVIK